MPGSARWERGWALHGSMLLVVLFWGLAFIGIKQALEHMSWVTLTFLRFAVADVLFAVYLLGPGRDHSPPTRQDLPALLALGLLGFTGYHLFLNLGEADPDVTAGTAALIIAAAPAFLAIFAIPILKERLTTLRAGGIGLAFVGLGVMVFFAHPGSGFRFQASEGALAVLPPAVFAALYAVFGKGYLQRYRPFVFVAYTIVLATLLTLPLVLWAWPEFSGDIATMGVEGFLPVLFLGVFPTFIAYGLWFRGLERMPTASAGAYVYLSTLVAVVGGILILGESLTGAAVVGGGMVIAGVVVAQQFGRR